MKVVLSILTTVGGIVGPRESKMESSGFLGLTILEKKHHHLRKFADQWRGRKLPQAPRIIIGT